MQKEITLSLCLRICLSNRAKSPPKARGTTTFNQDNTKRTEDNHSLLADEHNVQRGMQNDLFGQFKGFTISPIKLQLKQQQQQQQGEIIRPAPPVPSAPVIPSTHHQALNSTASQHPPTSTKQISSSSQQSVTAPKLPPTSTIPTTPKLGTSSTFSTSRQVNSPNVQRSTTVAGQQNKNRTVKPNSLANGVDIINSTAVAPALPPLNPGSTARPIISSPILENSTCTAKELLSPLRNAPKVPLRQAPETPQLKHIDTPINKDTVDHVEDKKPKEMSTINRIASFLKSHDKKPQINSTSSLPRNSHKLNKIDKNSLRSIEISKPIPQSDIEVPSNALSVDSVDTKNVVMRAQSMRGTNVTNKPTIQSFGSMRQPNGTKRPISIPSGVRPKSPPPPRPPVSKAPECNEPKVIFKVPSLPGYQPPTSSKNQNKQNQYDDCLNESLANKSTPSSDNIYAVIEETPISSPDANVTQHTTSSGSSESVGLLGEIVSEIQSRNLESIYSTNTVGRKKKEQNNKNNADNELYVNTSSIYKSPPGSEYSNASNISSTSSGYITPAAVNPPVKQENNTVKTPTKITTDDNKQLGLGKTGKVEIGNKMNTFKSDRGSVKSKNTSLRNSSSGNRRSTGDPNQTGGVQTPPSPSKGTTLNRQTTPPNLRTRKPSPSRGANNTPKSTTTTTTAAIAQQQQQKTATNNKQNSPDLVTSCANSKITLMKSPDVLNVKKPTSVPVKPILPKTMPKVTNNNNKTNTSTNNSNSSGNVKQVNVIDKKSDNNKPPIATKLINKSTTSSTSNDVVGGNNPTSNNKTISTGAKIAARQNSNVAALQQKFETKTPILSVNNKSTKRN